MTRTFNASVWREDDWFVAQCLEVDVASQGRTAEEAIDNLREALELHLEDPVASTLPDIRSFQITVDAA